MRGRSFRRALLPTALVTVAISLGLPGSARAGNEAHVRTPVLWPSKCAVVVERSVEPVVHFDYSIPVEDTELTPDELPDSRTHQFIALCRDRPLSELLPAWITRDDFDRSVAAGLVEDPQESGPLAAGTILDESSSWTGCFLRITADDDRRPISFEQAALGVDWNTSEAEVGVWTVAGHTFEPAFNLWRDRPGFVKIIDERGDPDQDLPAIALLGAEQIVEPGAPIELEGCVDALEPATLELEWAEFSPELDWRPLDSVAVEADGPLDLTIQAPVEAAERELLIRARLVDARGRERLAHAPARVSVLPCSATGCPSADPEPPEVPVERAPGCACVPAPSPARGLLILLVTALALRRRPWLT